MSSDSAAVRLSRFSLAEARRQIKERVNGAFCAHVRNKIIRRCHEWMLKQEEGK